VADKIKCEACYKRYKPNSRNRCPGCGTHASWSIDPTDAFIADLQSPDAFEEAGPSTEDRISELEFQVEYLEGGLRKLAWGVFLLVISPSIGVAVLTLGTAEKMACVLEPDSSCGADTTIFIGWAVLIVGGLVGLGLVIGAAASRYDNR